ncbi:MAG: Slp family lipoprotein [Rhodanobacteraceae bacterium]
MRINAMDVLSRRLPRALAFLFAALLLGACAPAPIYKTDSSIVTATPSQVAAAPDRYRDRRVIWGGRIVAVRNLPGHSEIEMLGLPLDPSQRPRLDQPAGGRFIAIMPGFVEPMDYPPGTLMTLRGRINGTRMGKVGEADYAFPLVRSEDAHRWTPEAMQSRKPNIRFGVGVGYIGGIR